MPGAVVAGKYRVVRHLGSGSMGSVWSVVNELTERSFALKLVAPESAGDPDFRARLLREARAAGRISQRNVVQVYDVGETDDGSPFLVMELLAGESLEARLARRRQLPEVEARAIAAQIARALIAAHTAGVVHRDLKPANVFLHTSDDGLEVVKVVDFGVSKVLAGGDATSSITGLAIGSPAYMSPEQARGERNLDHRSDLWSLGVVLYEMLCGVRPFLGDTPYDTVAEILKGRIPRVSEAVPMAAPEVVDLVDRCLQRARDARPASAREVLDVLDPAASEVAIRRSVASIPEVSLPAADTSTVAPATRTAPAYAPMGMLHVAPWMIGLAAAGAGSLLLGALVLVAVSGMSHEAPTAASAAPSALRIPAQSVATTPSAGITITPVEPSATPVPSAAGAAVTLSASVTPSASVAPTARPPKAVPKYRSPPRPAAPKKPVLGLPKGGPG